MNTTTALSRFLAVTAFVLCLTVRAFAANTTTQVEQVAETVALTTDVDYVVTSTTPFGTNGVVDIQNTDHAVLILSGVKPSKVLSLLSAHVKINGAVAVNDENCQVKLYNRGTIIMPYGKDFKPLTVFSERAYNGESYNSFGLENDGGFMNTLPSEWNNRIRSFKLKRGYMVTFSTRARGRGYSRCFVAAYADREVNFLPAVLDGTITSYRVFKWYNGSKAGLANDTRKETCDALNVQSCYSFGLGEDRGIDCECVPHHIYEDWPSPAACGSVTYSPHLKTNNEPGNSSDPSPQDVATVLANWENLMATGLRLCSPSSHDGSWAHFTAVLDSIDARGWRCDILDIHSYWEEGSFGNLEGWYNRYKRPIWISEWIWGSSWNGGKGIFNVARTDEEHNNPSDAILNKNNEVVTRILNKLNGWNYVERYFYWNSEANCSKLYYDGKMTPTGQTYATMNTGLGYNASIDTYIPTNPRQYSPSQFTLSYDKKTRQADISWYEANGEYNQTHTLQRSTDGGTTWTDYYTPAQKETAASYSYTDEQSRDGYRYRVHVVDLEGVERNTIVKMCAITDIEAGDAVSVGETTMYVGGNMLINGDFDLGFTGWTNGKGQQISYPNFQIANVGDEQGNHLVSWTSQAAGNEGSIRTLFDVVPNGQYYFAARFCNTGGQYQSIDVEDSGDNGSVVETPVFKTIACSEWTLQDGNFNVGNHSQIFFKFRWLNMARMDQCFLARLFPTFEEAQADALQQACQRAKAFINYNTTEVLNTELQDVLDATYPSLADSLAAVESALDMAYAAYRQLGELKKLTDLASTYITLGMPGSDALMPHVETARSYTSAAQVVQLIQDFNEAFATMPEWETTGLVQNGEVNSAYAWQNKSTYDGDQRSHTVLGRTCWNSWWSGNSAKVGDGIMKIQQTLTGLDEGLYYLTCDATTEHSCISDQHAFMMNGNQTAVSPVLTYDRFDYPGIANADRWETLATTPLHVGEEDTLYVGFESSKQGAVDGAWIASPDKTTPDYREGWWCATGFKLHRLPLHQRRMTAAHWGTVCLPAAVTPGPGVQLYEVAGVMTEGEQQYVCLSPIEKQEAGVPAVYYCDRAQANFFETGTAVTAAVTGTNNLRGVLAENILSRRSAGAAVMVDGAFYLLGDSELPYTISKYNAYISKLTGVTELSAWDGVRLPLHPQGTLLGIHTPAQQASSPSSVYSLQGRPVSKGAQGIVIWKNEGAIRKVLKK